MKKFKKRAKVILPLLLIITFALSGIMPFVPTVSATSGNSSDNANLIRICHSTSYNDDRSNDKPYESISVNQNAISGHDGHNGTHGTSWYFGIEESWGDIIPPASEWGFKPSSDNTGYSGKNWDKRGKEIWNNDCEIPGEDVADVDEDSLKLTSVCVEEEDSDSKTKWKIINESGVDVDYTYEVYSGGETGSGTVGSENTSDNPHYLYVDESHPVTLKIYWGDELEFETVKSSSGEICAAEEENFNLVAYKVVCESEEDLPDWAKDQNSPNQITESVIEGYIDDSNGGCWFESDWKFQWGEEDADKMPGDHTGVATGEGWTTFDPTDEDGITTINVDYTNQNHIWVREVLKEGYIPFSDFEEDEESVSAELLCSTDGYKYDNYDRVDNPEKDGTYYCVGFNVPKDEDPEIPVYESEDSCPADHITEYVNSYQVDSTDSDGTDIFLGEGIYLFEASGTFIPTSAENWYADAGYSTDNNWSSVLSDYGIQGNDPHYGAHSLLADLGSGVGIVNWGDYDSSHEYSFYYEIESEDDYPFLIGDRYGTWFSTEWDEQVGVEDNQGYLDLDLYKCVEEEEDQVKVEADKIICDSEEYLPNMAGGDPITATTAADWLAEGEKADHCWLDEDWKFQWKEEKVEEAPDNEGELNGWNTFTANQPALISNLSGGETIALREVMDDGHIPFSGVEGDDESAEFYCANDVGNYDNLEWIQNVTPGDSYYCIGFNVPIEKEIEVCKLDEMDNYLEGWQVALALKDPLVDSTSINVTDDTGTEVYLPEGDYLIEVSGTYKYGSNEDRIADAGYSYRPTNEWMSGFDLASGDGLMVQVDNNPVYWGPFTTDHVYTSIYHHDDDGPVNLHIQDDVYGDNLNDGDLSFKIFEIISEGETEEDGCVNFSVPLGDYLLEEENRMDWMNVSGLGSVNITEEETFNIVNGEDFDGERINLTAHKIVCDSEEHLPNWGADQNLGSPITSETASDFLASVNQGKDEDVCWLEPNWEFEWGYYGEVSNPGDSYTGEAGGNWNPFGPTDTNGMVSITIPLIEGVDRLDFREVLQEGYIPFSFEDNNETNVDDESAEFYCGEDVFNYDNWDWIEDPEDGEEYYCIGFNSLKEVDNGGGNGNGDDDVNEDSLNLTSMCIDNEDSDSKTKWRITNDSGVDIDYTYEVYSGGETGSGTVGSENTSDDPYYFYVDEPHSVTLKIYWGDEEEFVTTKASGGEVCKSDKKPRSSSSSSSGGSSINLLSKETTAEEEGFMEGVTVEEVTVKEASTSADPGQCETYLNDFLRFGADNNPQEVMKLQLFLNVHMDEDLPVDGVFGRDTFEAVERFQLEYKDEVLRPWVEAGIHNSEDVPTGYVFETTRRWINMILCPELGLDMPDLSVYFRESLEDDFDFSDLDEFLNEQDEDLEAEVKLDDFEGEEPGEEQEEEGSEEEEEEGSEEEEDENPIELLAGAISGGGRISISHVFAGLIGLVSLSYLGYQAYIFFKRRNILSSWN